MNIFGDMEEHHVWAWIATIIMTSIVLIVSIASYYGNVEDERIERLLNEGHDPMMLACLYNYSDDLKMQCYTLFHATAKVIEEDAKK